MNENKITNQLVQSLKEQLSLLEYFPQNLYSLIKFYLTDIAVILICTQNISNSLKPNQNYKDFSYLLTKLLKLLYCLALQNF